MDDPDGLIYVDGQPYSADDLTFREQREMRRLYRELVEDPKAELSDAAGMDYFPLLAFLLRHRDDPDYTLKQALDLKAKDLLTPPTKPAAKRAAK